MLFNIKIRKYLNVAVYLHQHNLLQFCWNYLFFILSLNFSNLDSLMSYVIIFSISLWVSSCCPNLKCKSLEEIAKTVMFRWSHIQRFRRYFGKIKLHSKSAIKYWSSWDNKKCMKGAVSQSCQHNSNFKKILYCNV